jgi:hypothetical protein
MNKRSSQNCTERGKSIIPFMLMTILCLDDGTVRKCAVLSFQNKMPRSSGLMRSKGGYGSVTQVRCNTVNTAYFDTSPSAKNRIDITNLMF